MPKLPQVNAKQLAAILEKKGFQKVRQKGSHVVFRNKDSVTVVVPDHGSQEIPKGTLNGILKDAGISRGEIGLKGRDSLRKR